MDADFDIRRCANERLGEWVKFFFTSFHSQMKVLYINFMCQLPTALPVILSW